MADNYVKMSDGGQQQPTFHQPQQPYMGHNQQQQQQYYQNNNYANNADSNSGCCKGCTGPIVSGSCTALCVAIFGIFLIVGLVFLFRQYPKTDITDKLNASSSAFVANTANINNILGQTSIVVNGAPLSVSSSVVVCFKSHLSRVKSIIIIIVITLKYCSVSSKQPDRFLILSADVSSVFGAIQYDFAQDIKPYTVNKRVSSQTTVLPANAPYNTNTPINVQVAVGSIVSVNLTLNAFITYQYLLGVDLNCTLAILTMLC